MYKPIPSQRSCATTWLAAANELLHGDAYNVILDVENPCTHDKTDHSIIDLVNRFLVANDQYPITTVANTIFPRRMYQRHGAPQFYEEYLKTIDALTSSKQWGRYFERMIRPMDDKNGDNFNPLARIIDKLKHSLDEGPSYKAAYEISIYDPAKDSNRLRNAQCLSYLSFKLHPARKLLLTAVYRNHSYITRCLGNLIGLGWLMEFVAEQIGVEVGSLTVISTHAEIDMGADHDWGKTDAQRLINDAVKVLDSQALGQEINSN